MSPDITAALPLIVIGLVLLVLVVWLVMRTNRKSKVVDQNATTKTDVLDDGAERAKRNQALIDAPRAPEVSQGPLSAAANTQTIAAAPLGTDAEAGPEVAPVTTAPVSPPAAPPATPPATPTGGSDDLTRIKGVGPKLAALLGDLGVSSFGQIASWSAADIERMDGQLGRFSGRIARDQWVAQARLLAAGDEAGFSERFGRNG
jgi:predicted flap endonuclease-1-like 5' DNA nuclease